MDDPEVHKVELKVEVETPPEPKPKKRWNWKLFQRRPREPFVEYDEHGQPERAPLSITGHRSIFSSVDLDLDLGRRYEARNETRANLDALALMGFRGASAHHAMIGTMGGHYGRPPIYWASSIDGGAHAVPPPEPPIPGKIYR